MYPLDKNALIELATLGPHMPRSVSERDQLVRLARQGYVEVQLGPPTKFTLTAKGRAVIDGKRPAPKGK
jgi:hypothetical protein